MTIWGMWGKPHTFKSIEKYREKIIINYWLRKGNIDPVNWKKLFERFVYHRDAIYCDSLTLTEAAHSMPKKLFA